MSAWEDRDQLEELCCGSLLDHCSKLQFLAAAIDPESDIGLTEDGRKGASLVARQLETDARSITDALYAYFRKLDDQEGVS